MFTRIPKLILLALTAVLLTIPTMAAETLWSDPYCFTAADFSVSEETPLTGVFLTQVPSGSLATLTYGTRPLQPGDAISVAQLEQLTLTSTVEADHTVTIGYLPMTSAGVGQNQDLVIAVSSGKNNPPVTKDSQLETFKNIPNNGTLDVTDIENEELTYQLVKEPKRGTVELLQDGTYTYTPNKNKVGEDSFTYTATDPAGNVSNISTVTIDIRKPVDAMTYADMTEDVDQFVALWMRDERLFTGETIAGNTCFGPDKAVTRGEFVAMLSKLTNLPAQSVDLTTGFADAETTPTWMQPYVVSALRAGVINGTSTEDGLVFLPTAELTGAEAAVMVQNALNLPAGQLAVGDFGESTTVPVWAEEALGALSEANFPVDATDCLSPITRRDVANLLYAASLHTPTQPNIIASLF